MPKGKRWSQEDLRLLQSALCENITYAQMHSRYFPNRSEGSISQAARKHFEQYRRRPKDWTMNELRLLRHRLYEYNFRTWGEVALKVPGRTASACKYAANTHLTPPEGKRYYLSVDDHMIRKYGPPKPWVKKLGRIVKLHFTRSRKTKVQVAKEAQVSRITLEHLLEGRRAPRMPLYVSICESIGIDGGIALSKAIGGNTQIKRST